MGKLNSNRKHINVRYKYYKVFRFGGTVDLTFYDRSGDAKKITCVYERIGISVYDVNKICVSWI